MATAFAVNSTRAARSRRPERVVPRERYHAAIVGKGLFASRILDQELRADSGRRLARRVVSRPRQGHQQPRVPIPPRRRCGRSRPFVVFSGSHDHDCRCGQQDQIDFFVVAEPGARFADAVSLAGRLFGVFRQPIERRSGSGIHPPPARASREAIVPGGTARMVAAIRDRMGRETHVGLIPQPSSKWRRLSLDRTASRLSVA